MPFEVLLPSLSAGMEDAVIARWLKAAGQEVAKGEVLAEVETDKATMELEAEVAGRIGALKVAGGGRANVNDVIAVLLLDGEDDSMLAGETPKQQPRKVAEPAPAPMIAPTPTPELAKPTPAGPRHSASPLARRIAAERGINLSRIAGSGPKGRIVRIDVERAAQAASTPIVVPQPAAVSAIPAGIGDYEAVPLSPMRRTIARRLVDAKTTVPHFYLNADCDVDALLALRAEINEGRDKGEQISVNDFVLKAVAVALRKVPEANAVWTDEAILRLRAVDIAVAVATDGGLITPVLRDADQKSLGTISSEVKALAIRAREGKLKPDEYQGGGFSVSNLGMYGVKSFTAIINPPQSCILAVGVAERRPVGRGDEIVLANVMSCTLSVDHRSVDGAVGAKWLAAFKAAIEHPLMLLV
ncbi:pyruvate dehydrogenase complex dihydrolipoamide acetyltransferase [Pseudaminobacter arsenicus]|uniref:Acetyltransferase component of pyruvate dehydrogenase complex n=1 Tax=Borborobacter arsenicus TaxID=1851146 RepID=A0A432V1D0_9HYPH|nr:pyruvate dehydrogenase complex dihydrolipoamide acetyltransferase [Pseudaminobacter arsenicus]RUM96024.1 pyruvate dehydrogenase complex dihydrolipoamide acetyltransferase [Pseudaminobacter arsenicus]